MPGQHAGGSGDEATSLDELGQDHLHLWVIVDLIILLIRIIFIHEPVIHLEKREKDIDGDFDGDIEGDISGDNEEDIDRDIDGDIAGEIDRDIPLRAPSLPLWAP